MGTRSLTVFNDTWENEEIAVFYRQFDGYPEGHGKELLDLLKDMRVVNGMNSENMKFKIANGMDCLAAQVVAHLKMAQVISIYTKLEQEMFWKNLYIHYIINMAICL